MTQRTFHAQTAASIGYPMRHSRFLLAALVSVSMIGSHIRTGAYPQLNPPSRSPAHGTINVFLGNENGLVVLADSRLTYANSTPVPDPAQKLFQLDSKSVAAFAGFASQSLPMNPQVANKTSDVIQSYGLSLQGQYHDYHPNLRTKLNEIAFILQHQLELITAIARDVPQGRSFDIELTVAGFDNDGVAKIESVEMRLATGGTFHFVGVDKPREILVQKNLAYYLRGVELYAEDVLQNPEKYAALDPAIAKYAVSMKTTSGSDLSLQDLRHLALFLAKHTAEKTQTVGPPYAEAEFSAGKISGLELPFPQPNAVQRRRPFLLEWENHFDSPSRTPIFAPPPLTLLFVNNDVSDRSVILDGGYFYGNTFTHCTLFYDGGTLNFVDGANDVSHASLLLGIHAHNNPGAIEELRKLKWASIKEDKLEEKEVQ